MGVEINGYTLNNIGNAGLGTTSPAAKLHIAGNIKIVDGSEGLGKVLTSDALGVATWQTPASGGGSWSLTGNSGTSDITDFIGTIDNMSFNIRVNNKKAGRLDEASFNAFYGVNAGSSNTSGYNNTANGHQALYANTSGVHNASVGAYSLNANTTGAFNTAHGALSLYYNNSGGYNTALGAHAMLINLNGYYNTASGYAALSSNYTGHYNTATGGGALQSNVSGDYNTALGYVADVSTSSLTNATAIGNSAIVNASNKVRIGDVNVTVIEGQPAMYTSSDGRFKNNISEDDVKGLEFIKRLRPVTYNFDTRKFEEFLTKNMPDSVRTMRLNRKFSASTSIRRSGFIAQEVEKAANEIGYNFDAIHKPDNDDDNYSLAYGQFVVPLVKAIQELSKQNDELKKEMSELKALIKGNTNTEGSIKFTEANSTAKLFQNTPNPFSKLTVIRYSLPSTAKQAVITVTSLTGVKIKEFDLKNNKAQNVEISGGQLVAGTYIYSLIVDGTIIDSKKMILTD